MGRGGNGDSNSREGTPAGQSIVGTTVSANSPVSRAMWDAARTGISTVPEQPASPTPPLNRTVYVGGIEDRASREVVLTSLSAFGYIQQHKICGRFGFFEYATDSAACECISQLNGKELCGRTVKVVKSESVIKDGCRVTPQNQHEYYMAAIKKRREKEMAMEKKFQQFQASWHTKQHAKEAEAEAPTLPPSPALAIARLQTGDVAAPCVLPTALLPRAMGPRAAELSFPGQERPSNPCPKKIVHMSGLETENVPAYRDYTLLVMLSLYGTLERYQICGHYAFFEFTEELGAERCIAMLDGKKVMDRTVRVSLSRSSISCPQTLTPQEQERFKKAAQSLVKKCAQPAAPKQTVAVVPPRAAVITHPTVKPLPVGKNGCASTVHIGGIDSKTPISSILTALFAYGNIHQYRLCGDPSKPTRYGFFEFATEDSAKGCMELHGRELLGRKITVAMSTRPVEFGVRLTGEEQIHYFNNRLPPEPEVPATSTLKQFAGCWTPDASSPPPNAIDISPPISPPLSPPRDRLDCRGPSRERSPCDSAPPQLIHDDEDGISVEEITPLKRDECVEVSF